MIFASYEVTKIADKIYLLCQPILNTLSNVLYYIMYDNWRVDNNH